MKKVLSVLLSAILACSLFGSLLTANAATQALVQDIVGDKSTGQPFGSKTFDDFYNEKGNGAFVWFNVVFNQKVSSGMQSFINQQVMGDMTLKKVVSDKIKLNGKTVNQINVESGNQYAAMIAFEPAHNDPTKLQMAVWLSWGATGVNNLFNKDNYEKFTFELMDGFKVPGEGYKLGQGPYVQAPAQKYEVSIVNLEYGFDHSNKYYDADKNSNGVSEKDWVYPKFWEHKDLWKKVSGPGAEIPKPDNGGDTNNTSSQNTTVTSSKSTATTTSSKNTAVGTNSTVTVTSSEAAVDSSALDVSSEVESVVDETGSEIGGEELSSKDRAEGTGNNTTKPKKSNTALIVILIVAVVLIAGGAAAYYFLVIRKKNQTGDSEE